MVANTPEAKLFRATGALEDLNELAVLYAMLVSGRKEYLARRRFIEGGRDQKKLQAFDDKIVAIRRIHRQFQ